MNIDAKLINSSNNNVDSFNDGVVELQNGCACCSLALADELMTSILTLTKNGERQQLDVRWDCC